MTSFWHFCIPSPTTHTHTCTVRMITDCAFWRHTRKQNRICLLSVLYYGSNCCLISSSNSVKTSFSFFPFYCYQTRDRENVKQSNWYWVSIIYTLKVTIDYQLCFPLQYVYLKAFINNNGKDKLRFIYREKLNLLGNNLSFLFSLDNNNILHFLFRYIYFLIFHKWWELKLHQNHISFTYIPMC